VDRIQRQILATQSAQQKAIDELYFQIAELKRRLDQPRHKAPLCTRFQAVERKPAGDA
jgi:hypothetical protein